MDIKKETAARIQAALDKKKWTAGELADALAKRLGRPVHRQTAYGWVKKDKPSIPNPEIFTEVAEVLGESLAWLRDGVNHPASPPAYNMKMVLEIIDAVEKETSAMGLSLSEDERARIVDAIYSNAAALGRVDRNIIHVMISLRA